METVPVEGVEKEYEGIYVLQWEVSRLVITSGRKLFGMVTKKEKWLPVFPSDFSFPFSMESLRGTPGKFYRLRVRGVLGEKGSFGHRGACSRQISVSEVLLCQQIEDPGGAW